MANTDQVTLKRTMVTKTETMIKMVMERITTKMVMARMMTAMEKIMMEKTRITTIMVTEKTKTAMANMTKITIKMIKRMTKMVTEKITTRIMIRMIMITTKTENFSGILPDFKKNKKLPQMLGEYFKVLHTLGSP